MKLILAYLALSFFCLASCSRGKKENQQDLIINDLASPAGVASAEPFLYTDDSLIYLSWVEKRDSNTSFKVSRLENLKWTEPRTIAAGSTWFVNWADYPMLAASGKNLIAHFLDKGGDGTYAYDVKVTLSTDGGENWTDPKLLNDDNKEAEHGFVTLLPYGDNFFLTWLDGRNTAMEGMENMDHHGGHHGAMSLRAAVMDTNGNKVSEWELDNKTCDCCQTSAAITTNGPVVVYRDRTDDEIRDISIVRLVDGQWTTPKPIYNDNWKIAGCPVNGPRVVADGNDLAVTWYTIVSDTSHVNVIFSTNGGVSFGNPIRVDDGNAIGRVDIVMLDDKSAMVSWMEGTTIKAAKVNNDGTKEPSITIGSSSESRSSGFPQMTKSGNRLIFAWTDDKEKNIKIASLTL